MATHVGSGVRLPRFKPSSASSPDLQGAALAYSAVRNPWGRAHLAPTLPLVEGHVPGAQDTRVLCPHGATPTSRACVGLFLGPSAEGSSHCEVQSKAAACGGWVLCVDKKAAEHGVTGLC